MARRTVGRSQRWTDRVIGRWGYAFSVCDTTLWDQPEEDMCGSATACAVWRTVVHPS